MPGTALSAEHCPGKRSVNLSAQSSRPVQSMSMSMSYVLCYTSMSYVLCSMSMSYALCSMSICLCLMSYRDKFPSSLYCNNDPITTYISHQAQTRNLIS